MGQDQKTKCVAIVSGGLDSITMLYDLLDKNYEIGMVLSFNYGQRHKKELRFAKMHARQLGIPHEVVDLSELTKLISNSALTAPLEHDGSDQDAFWSIDVPEGHYAEDSMKATVVPNRNMIMLSIAAAVAVNNKWDFIATGVHSGDHFVYPDCRPEFIAYAGYAIQSGNEGFANVTIVTPFLHCTKEDIAIRAFGLGVPIHLTWSCYKGGENHCGKCGTCVERLEAINLARETIEVGREDVAFRYDITDLTVYDDEEFWKTAKKEQ